MKSFQHHSCAKSGQIPLDREQQQEAKLQSTDVYLFNRIAWNFNKTY